MLCENFKNIYELSKVVLKVLITAEYLNVNLFSVF